MEHIIKTSKFKDHLYEYQGVYFHINPEWNSILITLSGGTDSAIMTYIICNFITNNNLKIKVHIASGIRFWKTKPWAAFHSLAVFNHLKDSFPSIDFIRHEFFVPPDIEYGYIGPTIKDLNGAMKSGDQITNRTFCEYLCFKYKINAVFSGVTMNIPNTEISGMASRDAEFSNKEEDLYMLIFEYNGIVVSNPLRTIDKNWVMRAYKDFNQLNLLEKTRSCEGIFDGLDYTTYVEGQYVPECNICYWCNERQIAKRNNGL